MKIFSYAPQGRSPADTTTPAPTPTPNPTLTTHHPNTNHSPLPVTPSPSTKLTTDHRSKNHNMPTAFTPSCQRVIPSHHQCSTTHYR